MAHQWTPQQEQAINLRGKSILVSAAAGSGKTAVLAERILRKVMDEAHPINIDQVVVVTFTKAAAGEMKERIRHALERQAAAHPENMHLQRQKTLIHHANITTIDSFCTMLIKNHFEEINLDPSFRIADEGESALIRQEALEELLEQAYAWAREAAQSTERLGDKELKTTHNEASSEAKEFQEQETKAIEPIEDKAFTVAIEKDRELKAAEKSQKQESAQNEKAVEKAKEQASARNEEAAEGSQKREGSQEMDVEKAQRFYQFMESYAQGKSDKPVEQLILDVYEYAVSYPYPKRWLVSCANSYDCETMEQFESCSWMKKLKQYLHANFDYAKRLINYGLSLCLEPGGPYMYEPALLSYLDFFERAQKQTQYQQLYDALCQFEPPTLSTKRDKGVDKQLRERVKALRDRAKNVIEDAKSNFFFQDPSAMRQDLNDTKSLIATLTLLTQHFMELYAKKKREKDVLDFSDLSHFALRILLDEEGRPTSVAREYAANFDEIMIDEYQDSNYIQEMMMTAISGKSLDKENLFMVGDAKQSIYRFRLARPEIFMEKYHAFQSVSQEDAPVLEQRVDLFANFRSRSQVLHSVNYIFEKIMRQSLGGIEYNEEAALHPGASFLETDREDDYNTNLLLYQQKTLREDAPKISAMEFEAKIVAQTIKQLVMPDGGLLIEDRKLGRCRACTYGDIAILSRSASAIASCYQSVFEQEQISLYLDSKTGYFDAEEIENMLNLLRITDNPLQDIAFAAVLKSPIGNFTEEELAAIRVFQREKSFYEAAAAYADEEIEDSACQKIKRFLQQLAMFRRQVNILPLHELIWLMLDQTGYGDYVKAMPGGEQRKANIDMFVQKAVAFEQTSYIGVFQFVQYIERMQKYNLDEAEPSIINEHENSVRMMTIHKSKGLEFPVVFVVGLGRKFNAQDEKAKVILHPELGIGSDFFDLRTRQKCCTLLKSMMKKQNHLDQLGEELRVLYVALTRAKEKLFLVGGVNSLEKSLEGASLCWNDDSFEEASLPFAGSYLDWIMAAINRHQSLAPLREEYEPNAQFKFDSSKWTCKFGVQEWAVSDLVEQKLAQRITEEERELLFSEEKEKYQDALPHHLKEMLDFCYPNQALQGIPAKVTVSELKRTRDLIEEDESTRLFDKEEPKEQEPLLPKFLQEKKETVAGVARGSAYHTVFENLDYRRIDNSDQIKQQIEALFETGKLDEKNRSIIYLKDFCQFAQSDLGQRMKQADEKGLLWREQPFVLGVLAKELYQEIEQDQTILVQGIIDAYFVEDGKIVIVDYKTDFVSSKQELIDRYHMQLQYYQDALERILEKPVKEKIIYSVRLSEAILV